MSADLPIKATLKAGGNQADPWITVEASTPDELVQRLDKMDQALSKVAEVASRFGTFKTVVDDLGAAHVGTTYEAPPQSAPAPQPAVASQTVAAAVASQGPPPFDPAPSGGSVTTEEDQWGNSYEKGRPDAPNTAYGPAVLKRGLSKAGKPYTRWIDPRDKSIPSVRASGQRDNPADLWEGDWGPRGA